MPLYAQLLVVSHVNAKAAMQRFTKSFCCIIDQNKMFQCSIHHNNYRVSFEVNANNTKLLWFYKVWIERGEVMNPSYDLNIPISLVMWYLSLFSWHKWIQRITSNTWFRYKRSFIGPWASLNVTVDLVNTSNIFYPHGKDINRYVSYENFMNKLKNVWINSYLNKIFNKVNNDAKIIPVNPWSATDRLYLLT